MLVVINVKENKTTHVCICFFLPSLIYFCVPGEMDPLCAPCVLEVLRDNQKILFLRRKTLQYNTVSVAREAPVILEVIVYLNHFSI